jgi:homocysteine S-methyltransferase
MSDFLTRLSEARPILLDGPTGTELQGRGIDLKSPLWSASAIERSPDVLAAIHRDYVEAGAEIITANTFRTHAINLAPAGQSDRAADLTAIAVQIARGAAADRAWVAGSIAPVADCYSPAATPDDETLDEAHRLHARNLKEAGVDLLLVETQVTIREGFIAARAAVETGLPTLVSFVCGADGHLLSGEELSAAARAVLQLGINGILVNCLPAERVPGCLNELSAAAGGLPIGAYANAGWMRRDGSWEPSLGTDAVAYGQAATGWLRAGARIIGSCCGTSPGHILELRRRLDGPSV